MLADPCWYLSEVPPIVIVVPQGPHSKVVHIEDIVLNYSMVENLRSKSTVNTTSPWRA